VDREKYQRYYSFITLPNVGRFSNFFHLWIQQEIFTFPTKHQLCSYTTLQNLKWHFSHFTTTAVTKTYIEINHIFIKWNSYYLTRITITCFWLNSNCMSCARSVVSSWSSSETMCQLNQCAQTPWQVSRVKPSCQWFLRTAPVILVPSVICSK